MKNKAKKGFSIIIILTLILAITPVTTFAVSFSVMSSSLTNPIVSEQTGIAIELKGNHPLAVGENVTLTFPAEYTLPSSIANSSVKLYKNSSEIVNGISGISVTGKNITLTLDTTVAAAELLKLEFLVSAGITNPSFPGSYTLQTYTSTDNAPVNIPVAIQSKVTEPLVSVYSNHVKKVASYEVVFRTANTDLSNLSGANNDTITIKFPDETVLPSTISRSSVVINNEIVNQGTIAVNNTTGNKRITLPIPSGLTIPKDSFVQIEISESAGITNPGTASGNYYLQAWTSKDTYPVSSAHYPIVDSMITMPEVTVSPNIVGEAGAYFINFRTSSEGSLKAGADKLYLLFPEDTGVPAPSISKSNVLVNGVAVISNPNVTVDPASSQSQMEIVVPIDIEAGKLVQLQIKPNANIIHPTSAGSYTITAWTSQDLERNVSSEYQIAQAIHDLTVWVSPDIAGQIAQYTVAVENGSTSLEVDDTITIKFPEGTVLTDAIINEISSNREVFIDGIAFTGNVTVNQADLTITLHLTDQIAPDQIVNILFTQGAGIKNPLRRGNYTVEVKTTKNIAYKASNPYLIQGNHIVNLSAQLSNNGINLNGEYLIQFVVSNMGGLLGGLDTITVIFPEGTTLPSSIGSSYIKLNDKVLDQNPAIDHSSRSIRIKVPRDFHILQNSNVKIDISENAGIRNPGTVGNYTLMVYTSRDPVAVESSPSYSIGKQISTPTVSISPNSYQSQAQYAVGLYTSDQGALSYANNDYIEILFPNGTSVSAYNKNYVTVNGKTASNVSVSNQVLKVYLPVGMTIEDESHAGVVISPSAGIRNPSAGTYQLKVRTSKDTSYVKSQSYTTTGSAPYPSNPSTPPSSSTNNDAEVELTSAYAGDISDYTIKYKTSSTGALKAGVDEITIGFNHDVELPDYISKELIKVNGVPVNTGWIRRNNQSIIFHLPSTVNVGNNQWITITIDQQAEIYHPEDEGTYLLYVRTTEDTRSAYAYYKVEGEKGEKFWVHPNYNVNNQIVKYDMVYTTGDYGDLKGGYDWLTLMLPTSHTQEQIIDNVTIKINGRTVIPETYEVSGKNLSFLLPPHMDIDDNEAISIVLKDDDHVIMPNFTGKFVIHMKTSQEQTWAASNRMEATESAEEDSSGADDSNDDLDGGTGGTDGPAIPTIPTAPSTPASPSNMHVVLQINKSTANVNGTQRTLDAAPQISNGITMVPLRFVTEVLGGQVDYRPDQKRIIILYDEQYLILTLDSKVVYTVDDAVTLNAAPKAVNGRTLVPLRFIAEWMDVYTLWDGSTQSITLQKN